MIGRRIALILALVGALTMAAGGFTWPLGVFGLVVWLAAMEWMVQHVPTFPPGKPAGDE